MMKKLHIIFLALMIALQSIAIPAFADAAAEAWTVSTVGTFGNAPTAEKTTVYKYDGSYSMRIVNNNKSATDHYIEVKNTLSAEVEEGTYTLEFYAIKDTNAKEPQVVIGETIIECTDITPTSAEAPSGDKGWKKYTKTFEYTGDATSELMFRMYKKAPFYCIDNVSLIKDGTATNLVTNADFEASVVTPDPEPDPTPTPDPDPDPTPTPDPDPEPTPTPDPGSGAVTKDFQPTKVMLSPGDGTSYFVLNWYNPKKSGLEKVSVYDITNGGETLLTDELSTTASEYVYYKAAGLTVNSNHTYKLVFKFADMEYEHYVGGALVHQVNKTKVGSSWGTAFQTSGASKYVPGEIYIDDTVSHSGKSSVKIVSNMNKWEDNRYFALTKDLPIESGKRYLISFYQKGEKVAGNIAWHMSWSSFESKKNIGTGTFDWQKVEGIYSKGEKQKMYIIFETSVDAMWLDDFECYEVDESNNKVTGINLFENGGFENLFTSETAELAEVNAEAKVGGVEFTWNKPSSNYNGVKLYRDYNGEKICIGTLDSTFTSLKLDNLEQDEEYTFTFVPLNSDYREGEPNEVTVRTLIPDYVVENATLSKGGSAVTSLSGAGTYTAEVKAINNTVSEGLKCEVIAALYKDGALTKVFSKAETLAVERKKAKPVSVSVSVPEGDGYTLKVFTVNTREYTTDDGNVFEMYNALAEF